MKSRKHNDGITHINNSWQIQVEAGHFACPMPYRWRGDVTVDTQCFLTNITQTLRIFSYFLHKNFTQSLRRHHANIITLDTDFYADITQYIYAKITQKLIFTYQLRKSISQNTHILRKYVYAVITQLSQFYAIILRRYYADITQNKLRNDYAHDVTQSLRK